MINKDGGGQFLDFMGGHSGYEGDIELMGESPIPPIRENSAHDIPQCTEHPPLYCTPPPPPPCTTQTLCRVKMYRININWPIALKEFRIKLEKVPWRWIFKGYFDKAFMLKGNLWSAHPLVFKESISNIVNRFTN